MTWDTNIRNLTTKVSIDTKALRTAINGNLLSGSTVDISSLVTTSKTTLVSAINEVKNQASGIINDSATTSSTTQTWSASKIQSVANAAAAQAKTDILGGASAAYDTLKELQDLIVGDESSIGSIMTALGLRVRVDTASQGLTSLQQQNARTNIDVYGTTDLGPIDTDYVALYNVSQT